MKLKHVELGEANEFVALLHRHHKPVVSHRFSVGCTGDERGDELLGVAIVGRPVARNTDYRSVVEVTRLCTNGTPNACSFLYSAAARAAKALGYARVQTFILASESGVSLKATGWTQGHTTEGGSWNRPSRGNRREDQPQEAKVLWYKDLA